MSDLFLERELDPPMTATQVFDMGRKSGHCLELYRVSWIASMLAIGGGRMLCHFRGPDAESVRTALRRAGPLTGNPWAGSIHEAPGLAGADPGLSNVMVTRRWDRPVELPDIQAIEDAGNWCLEVHGVRFVRTFFSSDRRRMACLYQAPDAESVRLAQAQAGMPMERVWAFETLQPGR